MKAKLGLYDNHEAALTAVRLLKNDGFPVRCLIIIGFGQTEAMDNEMKVARRRELSAEAIAAGIALGAIAGLLNGIGLLAIPGLQALYRAGALLGVLAGGDAGLLLGGLITLLANLALHEKAADGHKNELMAGKYLLMVRGTKGQVDLAMSMITGEHIFTARHIARSKRAAVRNEVYASPAA